MKSALNHALYLSKAFGANDYGLTGPKIGVLADRVDQNVFVRALHDLFHINSQ